MTLWTAKSKTGPFKYSATILDKQKNAWDKATYSEAGVEYHNGLWHTFYSGASGHDTVRRGRRRLNATLGVTGDYSEQIGYAFSTDGKTFTRSAHNPIVPVDKKSQAFAEAHVYFEEPHVYVYHTLRSKPDVGENIGVHILTPTADGTTPVSIPMPLIDSVPVLSGGVLFAPPVKARLTTAGGRNISTRVEFRLTCVAQDSVDISLFLYGANEEPRGGNLGAPKAVVAIPSCPATVPAQVYDEEWLVAEVRNGAGTGALADVSLKAVLSFSV